MFITPGATDFDTLLSKGGVQYVVPHYQRGYSWRISEEIQEFWDDVMENVGTDYFFGSMVINNKKKKKPEIIDGQQRMATVLIFIAAIRDYWLKIDTDSGRWLHEKYIEDRGIKEKSYFKLQLNFADKAFFSEYVLKRPDRREPLPRKGKIRETQKNILATYDFFRDKLESAILDVPNEKKFLEKILEQVLHNMKVILISVGSAEDGYTIFETLNDRGLDLSAADLFKNHIFMKAKLGKFDSKNIPVLVRDWDDLAENLDKSDITGFLRHYWLSKIDFVRKDELYKKFKKYIANKEVEDFVTDLKTYSEYYSVFEDPSRERESAIKEVLQGLKTLKAKGCYPLLLSAKAVLDREEDFLRIGRLIEILTFRYSTICNKQANLLERIYHVKAKELFKSKGRRLEGIIDDLKKQIPDDNEFRASFIKKSMIGIKAQVAYMLRKIEGELNEETRPLGTSYVHIEHIMPQSLTKNWRTELGEDKELFDVDLHRLGNLTLLGNRLGTGAANKLFRDKRNEYYSNSNIRITRELVNFDRWGHEQIESRQRYYFDIAKRIWDPAIV